jgi:poly-gamma-glutamate capsule biosynthesis protein CapA/YwtB (metallophosphatase superfamily)
MHPGNIGVLKAAQIDCCALANNRVLDWGVAGLLESLDTLTQAGIRVAGAGHQLDMAQAPAMLELGVQNRVLVFAFGASDSGIHASWAAIAVYRDRPILYGCGDFLDDYEGIRGYGEFRNNLVLMYSFRFDAAAGGLVGFEMVPLQVRNFRLNRPAIADQAWLRDTLDRECRKFEHRVVVSDDSMVLLWD